MIKELLLRLIKIYQLIVSPVSGHHCRFYPSCSNYTYSAIKKQGTLKGCWQGLRRVLRCGPWSPGGVDLPS